MSASFLSTVELRADDLYNMRCDLGYAQCEVCNTWGVAFDMFYNDDSGFHNCVECDPDTEEEEIIYNFLRKLNIKN
tara:strand:- start:38 stop:265 length:228 start_codon:yes stop_codon:yes gene_type:complete